MKEIWKDIIGYEGLYQISNLGRVKVLQRTVFVNGKKPFIKQEEILNGSVESKGYLVFALYKNLKRSILKAHRLIAIHFIPNPEGKPQINHIDGNKLNNNLSNLEWCTFKENAVHAFKTGLRVNPKGQDHGGSKLTDETVKEIVSKYKMGGISYRKLGKEYAISYAVIYNIMRGKVWSHITLKIAS